MADYKVKFIANSAVLDSTADSNFLLEHNGMLTRANFETVKNDVTADIEVITPVFLSETLSEETYTLNISYSDAHEGMLLGRPFVVVNTSGGLESIAYAQDISLKYDTEHGYQFSYAVGSTTFTYTSQDPEDLFTRNGSTPK